MNFQTQTGVNIGDRVRVKTKEELLEMMEEYEVEELLAEHPDSEFIPGAEGIVTNVFRISPNHSIVYTVKLYNKGEYFYVELYLGEFDWLGRHDVYEDILLEGL